MADPPPPGKTPWRYLALVALGFVVVLGIVAAAMYATDYGVEATVRDTDCAAGQVKVTTKTLGIDHTVRDVPFDQCNAIEPGNFVVYHLRTQRTILYEVEGGDCIYDSRSGPGCGGGNGGILGFG